MDRSRRSYRRGVAAVAMLVVMLVVHLIIIGMVIGSGRDQGLTVRRLESIQAFYAAEAGINMAYREMHVGADEDGDGTVGTISDDSNDANDPGFGNGQAVVTLSFASGQATLTSEGWSGEAKREIQAVIE